VKEARNVMLCSNGALVVFGEDGYQMPEHQTNLFCDALRALADKGVVTGKTSLTIQGVPSKRCVNDFVSLTPPEGEGDERAPD